MGYYHPSSGGQKEIADMYGVGGVNHSNRPGAYAKPGNENRTSDEVERDIRGAMMNDYSTREFLKYNEGVRDEANEIKNLREQNEFIHNAMKQDHKDAGNGGKYTSGGDRGGVGMRAFQNYEQEQRDAADKKYASQNQLSDLKDKLMAEATKKAPKGSAAPSERLAGVKERMANAAGNEPPTLFAKDNEQPAGTDDQKQAANNFLGEYKIDVAKGANIKQDIKTSIGNAAQQVTDRYGR